MKIKFALLASVLLVACAGPQIKYATDDQKTFITIKDVPYAANENFDRALQFFAENLRNSNDAIQIKDKENRHIVSNLSVDCVLKNGFGTDTSAPVSFTVDFSAKDKKTRTQLKIQYISYVMPMTGLTHFDPSIEQIPLIDACQKKFIAKMDDYFQKKKVDW